MTSQTTGPDRSSRVAAALEQWRHELIEVGGPNTLLWFSAQRGSLDLTTAHPAGVAKLLAGHAVRLSDVVRAPGALATALEQVHAIRDTAREIEEERGLHTCFLAVGMATWEVNDRYPRAPLAPVLLRPTALRPTGPDEQDFHLDVSLDAIVNPVLLDYLRSARGVDIDPEPLVAAARRRGSPEAAYAALREQCRGVAGFEVRSSLVLSTFSTAKAPAISDLENEDAFVAHAVIAALAGDPDAALTVGAEAPPSDADGDLERERLVVDADATQRAVVEAVQAGSHLVVHGPPGTGKTQTITNLVTTLATDRRRMLLVAEKRAAIDGVVTRLRQLGLVELVLDPFADRQWAQGMVDTIERVAETPPRDLAPVDADLIAARTTLAEHRRALHEARDPWGVSADEAQSKVAELSALDHPPHSRVRLVGTRLHRIPADRLPEVREQLLDVARDGAWSTKPGRDPWYGVRSVGEDQTTRTAELVRRLAEGELQAYRDRMADLADRVGLRAPRTVLEADDQLALMSRVFATLEIFRPGIFEAPLERMVAATATRADRDADLSLLDRRRLRAQAKELLRPGPPPKDLHGVLVLAATQKRLWRESSGPGSRPGAPVDVPKIAREHEAFREELEWLAARLEPTRDGGDLIHADLDALQTRLERLLAHRDRLTAAARTITRVDELRRSNLGPLVDDFAARHLPVEQVVDELDFVWWSSVLDEISHRDPAYAQHDGERLRQLSLSYADADREHRALVVERVRAEFDAQVRRAVRDFPDQVEVLRAAASHEAAVPDLRHLLQQAPELLTSLRPCWAMSPLAVAQYVPAGLWFDVAVADEASQIAPAHAVSAIARAEQLVVFGDPHQLPPVPFSVGGESTRAPAEPTESLLDAVSPLLPRLDLTAHYRSADERLVSFANAQVYRGGMFTLPGASGDAPVRYDVVDGAEGDGETSAAEVDRVVELCLAQLREHPEESVGVVTLGEAHATALAAALRVAVAAESGLAGLDSSREPLFVKPAARVQGEERDVVFLSLGYGRGPRGEVVPRFGPIGTEGGERAITVATTRARRRLTVVSAVTADDLAPQHLRSKGASMLRELLVHLDADAAPRRAETARGSAGVVSRVAGRRRRTASSGSVIDRPTVVAEPVAVSPVIDDLARRLRSKGLTVRTAYGAAAQPIDLVVEDPSRPGEVIVAVESDGLGYATTSGVRDRERLRPDQLRRLGWAYERVWTVDVFRDPARDVARIQATVQRVSDERAAARRRARS